MRSAHFFWATWGGVLGCITALTVFCSNAVISGTTDETDLTATALSSDSIALVWDAVSGTYRYRIYRSESDTLHFTLVDSTGHLSFLDGGLKENTLYYYYIIAFDERNFEVGKSRIGSATTFSLKIGYRFQLYNSFRNLEAVNDSGYIAVGFTTELVELHGILVGWMVMVSPGGEITKQNEIEGLGYSSVNGLCPGGNGFLLYGGTYSSRSRFDNGMIVLLDNNGNGIWSKQVTGADSTGIIFWDARGLPDGGFMLCGTNYEDFTFSRGCGIVTRIDSRGDTIWIKRHRSDAGLRMYQRIVGYPGGCFIAGITRQSEVFSGLVATIDTNGNENNARDFPGCRFYAAAAFSGTEHGDVLVGGMNSEGAMVKRLDRDLNAVWTHNFFNDLQNSITRAVITTGDGLFIACGGTTTSPKTGWYCKCSSSGDIVWMRTCSNADFCDVIQTGDGGFALCGEYTGQDSNKADGYIVKTDTAGILQ